MTISDVLDILLTVLGFAGAYGSLRGQRPFLNEAQMQTIVARFGRRRVRRVAAVGYGILGLIGLARVLGG